MNTIKVLFLAANPSGTTRLALDDEARSIAEKIRASEHRDSIEQVSGWATRADDLLQLLNLHKPHIVHFSGHGNCSGIFVVGTNGQPQSVSTAALGALFRALKDNIRVVFLNACHSDSHAAAITESIDVCIGMDDSVGDRAAITFAAAFYRAIGFGRSVHDAFTQGQVALQLEGVPEHDTPKLIAKNGTDPATIFLVTKTMTPDAAQGADLTAKLIQERLRGELAVVASLRKDGTGMVDDEFCVDFAVSNHGEKPIQITAVSATWRYSEQFIRAIPSWPSPLPPPTTQRGARAFPRIPGAQPGHDAFVRVLLRPPPNEANLRSLLPHPHRNVHQFTVDVTVRCRSTAGTEADLSSSGTF